MGRHVIAIWGVLLGLALSTLTAEGCSCSLLHPQQLYCSSDYAVKAEVLETELIIPEVEHIEDTGERVIHEGIGRRRFSVRLHKVFKAPNAINMTENDTFDYIYTAASDSLCGVRLDVGFRYLLTGHVTAAGEAHTGLCDMVELWDGLSSQQRKGVGYKYDKGCDCQVRHCFQPKCDIAEEEEEGCRWNIRSDPGLCYIRYTQCRRRLGNGCGWANTSEFKNCREQARKNAWNEP